MIKKIIYFFFFLIFTFIVGCSFDDKTGIWTGGKKERKRLSEIEKDQKRILDTVKLYSSEDLYTKELHTVKSIVLSEPKKNLSWEMHGMNLQNFFGHIYMSGVENIFLKKKIGKNKFSIFKNLTTPLVFNNNIIFADDTGTIFSIDLRGKINWKKNIYKKKYKKVYKNLTFSIYKNNIYIADNIGFIYKINSANGEVVWIKNHGIPLKSNIKIFKDNIFLINQDNRLLCLNVDKGSLVWDVRSVSSFIKSQSFLSLAISKDEDLIILNSSGDLVKLKTDNGRIYWTLSALGSFFAHDTDFFRSSNIVLVDNDIIFSTSTTTFSFNLINGQFNWQAEIGSINTPIIDGNNIFLMTDNGYFINLNRKNGKIIWSTNILKILKKKKQITKIAGYILGSSKVYIVTQNGYLIICSANSGQIESFKKIGDTIYTNPIISNGSLYILTENSKIIGFN